MIFPVRPPIRPSALVAASVYLLTVEPAVDVTRVSPSEAFEVAWLAVSFAFDVAALAASEVLEALRMARRPMRGLRINARVMEKDIVREEGGWTRSNKCEVDCYWQELRAFVQPAIIVMSAKSGMLGPCDDRFAQPLFALFNLEMFIISI